ncbi:MAG TPA: hypothetical protein VJT81_01760 [Burkholderiales bacterium]|nr:hypothetical protein [Burkholderiales bacterium]
MTKLRGILDSKGRRAVHERNLAYRAPVLEPLTAWPESAHKSQPATDNTVNCCGVRYSPNAHKLHVRGERVPMSCGDVAVTGLDDVWLAEQDARLKARRSPNGVDDAIERAEQVAAYYAEQKKRRTPRMAEGVSASIAD